MDTPGTILCLLLEETAIKQQREPPKDYNPEEQGEWDEKLITRKISIVRTQFMDFLVQMVNRPAWYEK
jgi:hypothetical protein